MLLWRYLDSMWGVFPAGEGAALRPFPDRAIRRLMSARFTTLGRYPTTRLRRNRGEEWSRRLVAEHRLSVDDLIWPVFVQEGQNARTPVASMPGVDRLTIDLFAEAAKEARDLGIPAIAIFPETDPKSKTPDAREAYNPDNLVCRAIRAVKKHVK